MRLVTLLAAAGLAYAAYSLLSNPPPRLPSRPRAEPPDASGSTSRSSSYPPAGTEVIHDRDEDWDEVDEASDESFPASDPPARY